jgi:hypothetical protein
VPIGAYRRLHNCTKPLDSPTGEPKGLSVLLSAMRMSVVPGEPPYATTHVRMSHARNTAAIREFATAKSTAARQRVMEALKALEARGGPVNFTTICRAAKVFKTFLYDPRHADLVQAIRRFRESVLKPSPTTQAAPGKSDTAKEAQIARLKEDIRRAGTVLTTSGGSTLSPIGKIKSELGIGNVCAPPYAC